VAIIFLMSVSSVVDVTEVILEVPVPCFLSGWSDDHSALLGYSSVQSLSVFVDSLFVDSSVTNLSVVMFDLSLDPGVVLKFLDIGNSVLNILDVLVNEVLSLVDLSGLLTLEFSLLGLKFLHVG